MPQNYLQILSTLLEKGFSIKEGFSLQHITTRVADALNAEQCVVVLLDEKAAHFVPQWPAFGLSQEQIQAVCWTIEEGKTFLQSISPSQAAILPPSPADEITKKWGERQVLIARIQFGDTLFGSLRVANKRSGDFNNEDANFLTAIAHIIAIGQGHIQERQQREKAQRNQQAIIEAASDYLYSFHIGSDGSVQCEFISPSFTRVFGLTLEDIDARGGWPSLVHPDDLPAAFAHVQKVVGNQPDVCEFRCLTKDGQIRRLRDYARPIWDEQAGRVVRIVGASQDFTQTKADEETLYLSEARYRNLVENIHEGIMQVDMQGIVQYANPAMCQLLGYSENELIGIQPEDVILPQKRQRAIIDQQHELRKQGIDSDYEIQVRRKDGQLIWLHIHGAPMYDADGNQIGSMGVHEDITERKKGLVKIAHQRDQLERLHALSMTLSALDDLPKVLQQFSEAMLDALRINRVSVWLKDANRPILLPSIFGRNLPESLRTADILSVDDTTIPLVAAALNSNQPIHVPDTSAPEVSKLVPRAFRLRYHVRSFLLLPLRVQEETLGFVVLDDTQQKRHFNQENIQLAQNMASTAALAIHNARLIEKTRKSVERWRVLHQVAQQFSRISQQPEEIYQAIHQAARQILPADAFVISIADEEKGISHGEYLIDKSRRQPKIEMKLGTGLSGQVIQSGQAVLIHDYLEATDPYHAVHFGDKQEVRSILAVPMRLGEKVIGMVSVQHYQPDMYRPEDIQTLEVLAAHAAVAIENTRLFAQEQQQRQLADALAETASVLTGTLELDEVMSRILEQIGKVIPNQAANIMLIEGENARLVAHRGYTHKNILDIVSTLNLEIEKTPNLRQMRAQQAPMILNDIISQPEWVTLDNKQWLKSYLGAPLRTPHGVIGFLNLDADQPNFFQKEQAPILQAFADQAALAIQNARRFEETHRRAAELESLRKASLQLTASLNLDQVLNQILEQALTLVKGDDAHIFLYDGENLTFGAALWDGHIQPYPIAEPRSDGSTYHVAQTGQRLIIQNITGHEKFANYTATTFGGAIAGLPLKIGQRVVGVMNLAFERPYHFDEHELRVLELLADQAAIAIENAHLYTSAHERLQQMETINRIDRLIAGSVDLNLTLQTLLTHVCSKLKVDAASILTLNAYDQTLNFATNHGFRSSSLQYIHLRLGEGFAGKVALKRQTIVVSDLLDNIGNLHRAPMLRSEGFVSYVGVPLIAKGQIIGVLEVFQRSPLRPKAEWLHFLETLAGQAAIAMDNASLFNKLQRANQEIRQSYEATLEGWAHALEFRDQETEGHSRRVVEMTLRLAKAMNIPKNEYIHIRRGALLHDIGKMGIPDSILLKEGPLTEQEWAIMRRHPLYAYQLLDKIPFLRLAAEIPYCHHERWDGSGYPQNLKGTAIPLAARLFAVVDIWDALSSVRPYRPAWSDEKIYTYLHEEAGKTLDPQVVSLFLQMLQNGDFKRQ